MVVYCATNGSKGVNEMATWGRNILGGIMTLLGGIWFLQGISVLPGTFMRGSTLWVVIGAVVCLAGLAVLTVGRQRPSS